MTFGMASCRINRRQDQSIEGSFGNSKLQIIKMSEFKLFYPKPVRTFFW